MKGTLRKIRFDGKAYVPRTLDEHHQGFPCAYCDLFKYCLGVITARKDDWMNLRYICISIASKEMYFKQEG